MMIKNIKILRSLFFSKRGFVLVYIIALMLIFGLLGALMVSLFSTSVTSSATQNDARRAFYISESGTRYVQSELWANDFSKSRIAELNSNSACQDNQLHFNLSSTEKFCINIFSPWFESTLNYVYSAGNMEIPVSVPEGQIPDGFLTTIPIGNPDVLLVNYNYLNLNNPPQPSPTAMSQISAIIPGTATSFQFTLSDDFVASRGEKIAIAVLPIAGNQTIPTTHNYLYLKPAAKSIFPAGGGAFEVQKRNFFYTKSEEDLNTGNILLSGISPVQGGSSNDITVRSVDPVILSPRNRLIISEGKSGDVTFGKSLVYATAIADTSIVNPDSQKPDIEFMEEPVLKNVLNPNTFVPTGSTYDLSPPNDDSKLLIIGGDSGFGSTWFNKQLTLGGTNNFCNTGVGCEFNYGIRTFFILNYVSATGNGDGLTFSLIDEANNTVDAVGGDIDMSELLAYAGNSRQVSTLTGDKDIDFLDGRGNGIRSPKMAVEFDGKPNGTNYICDPFPANPFCIGSSLNTSTRIDPSFDSVQYVFWGRSANPQDACCRLNYNLPPTSATYDDNRHDNSVGNPPNRTDLFLANRQDLLLNGNIVASGLTDNWLTEGPWAVRIEIELPDPFNPVSGRNRFLLRTWMKKCSLGCPEAGQFFRNTRFAYDWSTVPNVLFQQVDIDSSSFNRFIFGFTSATSVSQTATISEFQLSFIRPNDPSGSDP